MAERDGHLLDRAFHEAARAGWLFTAPNPRVGALALAGGHLTGRGHHARLGGPHAEEAALRDAGAWDPSEDRPVPGVVDEMVVSLEPCSTRPEDGAGKRRASCTELLREAGVKRVVVGARDPDPRHAGAGLEELRAEGVEVIEEHCDQERFAGQNRAFLRALDHPERPWVLLKWAQSFDGKIAVAGGASQWITGPVARAEVHALRALGDAVLSGTQTLLHDDPALTARPEDFGGEPLATQPLRVLLDPRGEVPPAARVRAEAGPRLWLRARGAPAESGPEDRVLELPPDDAGRLDLAAVLSALRAQHGVRRLLVEGGARLHGALFDAGLADAVVRYEAPVLLGGPRASLQGTGVPEPALGARLRDREEASLGPDRRCAYQWETRDAACPTVPSAS